MCPAQESFERPVINPKSITFAAGATPSSQSIDIPRTVPITIKSIECLHEIWANQLIHSYLVGCLNPCLQRTSVRFASPQPLHDYCSDGSNFRITSTMPNYSKDTVIKLKNLNDLGAANAMVTAEETVELATH